MNEEKKKMYERIKKEKEIYKSIGYKNLIHSFITQCEVGKIYQYIVTLRKEEYLLTRKSKLDTIRFIINKRKKNKLGLKLGMAIPPNVFDVGLLIYHANGIVINKNAKVGKNCKLHGQNCIGNNGKTEEVATIGDNVDIGIGAKIIGGIRLGNNIVIGANSVVTKDFQEDNITILGTPAHKSDFNRGNRNV